MHEIDSSKGVYAFFLSILGITSMVFTSPCFAKDEEPLDRNAKTPKACENSINIDPNTELFQKAYLKASSLGFTLQTSLSKKVLRGHRVNPTEEIDNSFSFFVLEINGERQFALIPQLKGHLMSYAEFKPLFPKGAIRILTRGSFAIERSQNTQHNKISSVIGRAGSETKAIHQLHGKEAARVTLEFLEEIFKDQAKSDPIRLIGWDSIPTMTTSFSQFKKDL